MHGVLARAMLLYDQGRYDLAEEQARHHLTEEPDDGHAHALLALCLVKREDWSNAIREVGEAVRLAPTAAYTHYVAGHVLLAADRYESAMREAEAAIQLDPSTPSHYALAGSIHLARRRWRDALDAAETGLALDPEHVECNNVRGMALVKLGRRAEAGATMRQTLALDPQDAFTHANTGWSLLHERKPKEAMLHFREALRLDPTMDWARAGIVEALKARNFVYRWMLAYFLFMSRLSPRAAWGIILGGWFGYQLLQQLRESHPWLSPYALPLMIAYGVFAVMTWLAYPLFNLMLRTSRIGRLALSPEQLTAANWIGGTLLLAAGCVVAFFVLRWGIFIDLAIMVGVLTIPVSGLFGVPKGWPRLVMIAAVVTLVGIMGVHVWRMAEFGLTKETILKREWEARQLLGVYAKAVLAASIGANLLGQVTVKKG